MSTEQDLETRALSVPDAESIVIATPEDYVKACELLLLIKNLRGEIDETFDPIIAKAWAAHKEALAQKRKVEGPLARAEELLKPKIAVYDAERERIRRESELLAQQKAKEEAERQQLAEAMALDALGEKELAAAKLDEPVNVPTVILPRTTPIVPGISMRQTWSAQVVSLPALVKGIVEGIVPIQAVSANMTFLNQQARSMKLALQYPGVKVISTGNIAARR